MDVERIRKDFPVVQKSGITYFDSACTTLKPRQVVDAVVSYYTEYTSCAGRSIHRLATRTNEQFEGARSKVARFVNARKSDEIVWTRNTTEAMNLVSHGLKLDRGDRVVTTNLEHTSGLMPWRVLADTGAIDLDFVLCNKDGTFDIERFKEKINRKTKVVSVIYTSNVTGTTAPMAEIVKIAHENGAVVVADGAQAAPHMRIDVKKLDVDFLAMSGHKMLGPTGIGCLYGKMELLEKMRQFIVGGETITDMDLDTYVMDKVPFRFEAGIQHYAGAIGMGAAVDYLSAIGMDEVHRYEHELTKALLDELAKVPNLSLIGPKDPILKCCLASFNVKGMEPHDIAMSLDREGIAVRSGMQCAYPFHKYIGAAKGSARASLYLYNTKEEIREFAEKLTRIVKVLS